MGESKVKFLVAGIALGSALVTPVAQGREPELGRKVAPQELAGWSITVFADGTGLPEGRGTVAQGKKVYETSCASCHGMKLEGGIGPALAGGKGTLASDKPLKTVGSYWPYASTLFDYIRRAMPFQAPQSLSNNDVYAVSGYILNINGLLPADGTVDAARLKTVKMPNRDGFYVDNRPDVKNPRCMKNCPPPQHPR
ncbi:cytochrome c [Cupriavidus sp. TA19]|uniref:c-type cytochrome n=1 Tax=Cupriavidus sp. TA19 TaxID=701108 RepID=UPI002729439A|nr:cytochrome c [Cupriavidus sp. TA19]GLC94274.1 cytochrome c [Cupriavidus sp. TA19]